MTDRLHAPTLFDLGASLPEGFVYQSDFLTTSEEASILADIRALSFGEVRMHGVVARRRVVQFGFSYGFASARLSAGTDVPQFLQPLRRRAAAFAGRDPDEFPEVLVTEYPPGATIGWHRDAPPFGIIVGISLLSACRFRLRRMDRTGPAISLTVEPRSVYLISGAARSDWQHSIPPTPARRYSITFRTLRRKAGSGAGVGARDRRG